MTSHVYSGSVLVGPDGLPLLHVYYASAITLEADGAKPRQSDMHFIPVKVDVSPSNPNESGGPADHPIIVCAAGGKNPASPSKMGKNCSRRSTHSR